MPLSLCRYLLYYCTRMPLLSSESYILLRLRLLRTRKVCRYCSSFEKIRKMCHRGLLPSSIIGERASFRREHSHAEAAASTTSYSSSTPPSPACDVVVLGLTCVFAVASPRSPATMQRPPPPPVQQLAVVVCCCHSQSLSVSRGRRKEGRCVCPSHVSEGGCRVRRHILDCVIGFFFFKRDFFPADVAFLLLFAACLVRAAPLLVLLSCLSFERSHQQLHSQGRIFVALVVHPSALVQK